MIGDSAKDILCGRRAGCGATILVRTGNGVAAEQELAEQERIRPDAVAADLLEAARHDRGPGHFSRHNGVKRRPCKTAPPKHARPPAR
jgi:hypothetical protein